MSNAAIYYSNPSIGTVAAGGVIPTGSPASIVRRFGKGVNLSAAGVTLSRGGCYSYYATDFSVSIVAAGTTATTAQLLQDGVPVEGASVTAAAAASGDVLVLNIPPALVRVGPGCPVQTSVLSVQLTGGGANGGSITGRVVRL